MTPKDEVRLLVNKIVDYCKPEKVILFGSMARGDFGNDSDIDLLVIMNSDEKRPFRVKKIFEALRGVNRRYPLDTIVYTPQELNRRLKMGDFFIKEIMNEGRIMYAN